MHATFILLQVTSLMSAMSFLVDCHIYTYDYKCVKFFFWLVSVNRVRVRIRVCVRVSVNKVRVRMGMENSTSYVYLSIPDRMLSN